MDSPTVGLFGDARSTSPRPGRGKMDRLRRAKLAAAIALTVLVGLSTYFLTYHLLVAISTPAAAASSTVTTTSGGGTATVPVTATPARPPS